MACTCGANYKWVKEMEALVCVDCGRHSPYQRMPSYGEVVTQNNNYRKMLEDICECRGDLDSMIDKARKLLSGP